MTKVYILTSVSCQNSREIIVDIFGTRKFARKHFDTYFNGGISTKNEWKKCPGAVRRYEVEDIQYFISKYRVRKA